MDRSVGFLDAMRDASFNARRRRQRSVRRLVNSDDYDFAAQWRVASEFVVGEVPHGGLGRARIATDGMKNENKKLSRRRRVGGLRIDLEIEACVS